MHHEKMFRATKIDRGYMSTRTYTEAPLSMEKAAVRIPAGAVVLSADLAVPTDARGLVVFAHGSGSSRLSPRNTFVARYLESEGLATLLADLLSKEEDADYWARFDIDLLFERLKVITQWAQDDMRTRQLAIGYFGASTGAAAALFAAADSPGVVRAVVSRGGRVDLAHAAIGKLDAPTLFIVGEDDIWVRAANEEMFRELSCQKKLAVVPHATHLFEEPGALERVADLSARWFLEYLK